ncbi:glyoxylate reductase [Aspergillus campestris IBT 28561]|uniref:Glyoxylate reductase n=1 Tax=Aspergillus campestris (strain IBT 28561) TaxID=1392248 RepID=A0A2I1D5V2_ASPC2|nr:glyoxylate reductase [Aspergillus campestris IBT 28561]PKY05254.1 glyoxylate reductase [Aspergillus campestris IBT 28561]
MSKPKVLLLGKIIHAHQTWNSLSALADLVTPTATNRADFIQECRSGKLDGVVAAYRTFDSVSVTGLVDEEIVNALPTSLQYLAHCGAGYDQVDVHACSARNPPIRVSNVPTAVDDATADVNMFLIIGALRNFNTGMQALRDGKWRGVPAPILGHDPQGKVLGILGMGGIGRNLKRKAEVFGMRVVYHNRRELSEEMAAGAQYVSFEELLKTSDVISLNLPLNKNTRHIISTPQFAQMKDGVVIVNTARGAVIDEAALVAALDSGKVYSAGLDVYEEEPKIHPGLVSNPNVMLVPHMGTWTVETQTAMEEWAMENVRLALETGKLKTPVPEQTDL